MKEYLEYRDELVRQIFKMVCNKSEAEDIVQDAYLNFIQVSEPIADPFLWLCRAARNLALNHIKHRDNYATRLADQKILERVHGQQIAISVDSDTSTSLAKALNDLPITDQRLLKMTHWEGLSQVEISKRLCQPYERTKKQTLRATNRLKKILGKTHFSCPA